MIALDTSVVVAAFASWDEHHSGAAAALGRHPRLPAHVLVESYSVLTRLPAPHTVSAEVVWDFLRSRFRGAPLALSAKAYVSLVGEAAAAGITGGAVYDALIAATVRQAGALLLTRDRRALPTYEKMEARYELIA